MLSRLAGKGEHSGIFQTAGGCRKLKVTEFGQTERLPSLSWSAAAASPRRPWRSLLPAPGVCLAGRWQATGSRARWGRVLAPRERGRRLRRSPCRWDSACPGALPRLRPGTLCPNQVQLRNTKHCRQRSQTILVHPGLVSGRVYIGRTKRLVVLWWICPEVLRADDQGLECSNVYREVPG